MADEQRKETAIKTNEVAFIGMSPGNSYFNNRIVYDLILFTAQRFSAVYIWVPDEPAMHTYKALGYSDDKACQKARKYGNALKNRSARAIEEVSLIYPNIPYATLDWHSQIESEQEYQKQLDYIDKLYLENREFYDDVRKETARVIQRISHPVAESALDEGVHYVLKEIAVCAALPTILRSNNVAVLYHRNFKVLEKFFSGAYGSIGIALRFVIVTLTRQS